MTGVYRFISLGLLSIVVVLVSCREETPLEPSLNHKGPSVAFYNGSVITMEPVSRVDEAVLVRGSRIVATGTSAQIQRMAARDAVEIDLGGRTIMPGFVDPHNHSYNAIFLGKNSEDVGTTYGEAQEALLELGTTAIGNPGVWPEALDDFLTYTNSEGLRLRSTLYLAYNSNCGAPSPEGWYLGYPPITDPQVMLRIAGIKFFTDGGSCNPPAYSWREDAEELLYFTAEELAAAVSEVQDQGYQVAIHALGDVAAETALDALDIVLAGGPNTHHHRIEHNLILRPELLPRYGEIDAIPVVFGYPFTCSILDGSGWHRLNDDPTAFYVRPWFFPWRALLDANPGLPVAWKSDGPEFYWPIDPIVHLWGIVTRDEMRDDGTICVAPPWLEAGGVDVEEALQMMTINGAYALGIDQAIGSLRAGKFADLIVLSENPLDVEPSALKDLEVLMTMVGGKVEYCQAGHEGLCPTSGG